MLLSFHDINLPLKLSSILVWSRMHIFPTQPTSCLEHGFLFKKSVQIKVTCFIPTLRGQLFITSFNDLTSVQILLIQFSCQTNYQRQQQLLKCKFDQRKNISI
uniref:Uncharacterized protein n=1 Tax=Arundo donax TaxID=35708 RepID=A0A0A9DH32_ARUDO